MAQKRRRRRQLEAKYVARRLLLVILSFVMIIVLVVFAGRYVWSRFAGGEEESGVADGDSREDDSQPEDESGGSEAGGSEDEPQEQDGEPEDKTEPEPDILLDDWRLLLVNWAYPLPDGFTIAEMETLNNGYQVDARIGEDLMRMIAGAKASGVNLLVCSGHRTVEYQTQLFNETLAGHRNQGLSEEDARARTMEYMAEPGHSEHHTGLAVDIVTPDYQNLDEGFVDTPAFQWLNEHAVEYGFILRYPKSKENITKVEYEPWHYRYVGAEHAKAITESSYCLEEYIYVAQQQKARQEEIRAQMIEAQRDIADQVDEAGE